MTVQRLSRIGLFSSDPSSKRERGLQNALVRNGVQVTQVIPWKVARVAATNKHQILLDGIDLTELERLIVLDLGANDIGAFFSRVGLLFALVELGVEVVNSVSSILVMRNKAETTRKLVSAGLPVPQTLITESIEGAAQFVRSNFPCILKPITGFGGMGVQLIDKKFDLENIYDYLKFHSQLFGKGAFLLQEYMRSPGYDIRALVLDNEMIASMQRVPSKGIVSNIHSGGLARPNDVDVSSLAVQAAKAVRGKFVGVDIIPDKTGNLWVLEVNATPGWTGLQSVTDFDITERIADILSKS
ncbi:MAG: ATP-grasp domain-containing protein [Candidatus Thorarchaeota archaeon]